MSEVLPVIGFIGAGRVGGTLARLLHGCGFSIGAVWNRTSDKAARLVAEVGAQTVETPDEVLTLCDIVFLTVADDSIAEIAKFLAKMCKNPRAAVVHTSGAHSAEVLSPLADMGLQVGALHPAYPFATDAMPSLTGVTFALEADSPRLSGQLQRLVAALGGLPLTLHPHDRPRYHAALVMVSNYAVALYAAGQHLLTALGASQDAADSALLALLEATTRNIRTRGIPDALTGPLVRADLGTVSAHLDALADAPDVRRAYLALAHITLPMVEARRVDIAPIQALLHQKENV